MISWTEKVLFTCKWLSLTLSALIFVFRRDGSSFIGTFKDNQKEGYGRLLNPKGKIVKQGKWKTGEFVKEYKTKGADHRKVEKMIKEVLKLRIKKFDPSKTPIL